MHLDMYERLFQIAEAQAGYFTTAQTQALGVRRPQLSRYAYARRAASPAARPLNYVDWNPNKPNVF